MSSNEDAFGVSVPMPAAPVAGNVFVWAREWFINKADKNSIAINVKTDFMLQFFLIKILCLENKAFRFSQEDAILYAARCALPAEWRSMSSTNELWWLNVCLFI